jgi:hypothetical protein
MGHRYGARMTDPEALVELIAQSIHTAIAPLITRIAVLEARPELKDAGPWQSGASYRPGDIVSFQGGAWICKAPTMSQAFNHECFRLLVKRGRDGKDGKDAP